MSCQWWRQKVPPFPASGCECWSGTGCWEWGHRSTVGKRHLPGSLPASDHLRVKNKTKNGLQRMKFRSTVIKSKQAQIPLKLLFQINRIYRAHFLFFSHVLHHVRAWELPSIITFFQSWILSSFIGAVRWQSALLKGTLKVSCWGTGAVIMYYPAQTCTCKNNLTLSITTILISIIYFRVTKRKI